MRILRHAVAILLSSYVAFAGTQTPPSSDESKFRIDPGLLNELYKTEVQSVQADVHYSNGSIEISPQFSYVNPSLFELRNDYFKVPYSESGANFPLFQLGVATPLAFLGGIELHGQARIGYGFREAPQSVRSQSGLLLNDIVALHWLPVTGSLKVAYGLPGLSAIKPFVSFGGGVQWLQQSGKLDGITQSFWIPFYAFSTGLTLLDRSSQGASWFGGINIGSTWSRSVGSTQTLNYWALDCGATFFL